MSYIYQKGQVDALSIALPQKKKGIQQLDTLVLKCGPNRG